MTSPSLYWYDYETFGTDPRVDRIAQFAGIRTDMDFNIIDEPVDIFCKASNDILPNPEACLITGITPQKTFDDGLIETDFIALIEKEFSTANTCVVGFNNIRFDDEFTRYSLYRNFLDPYAREWQNGCSRWDIIDLVRITRALRPDGIQWPVDENGIASNRLELITKANNISHEAAHDALSDVYATIAVAKLIKEKQPKLYDFVFNNKNKQAISKIVDLYNPKPVLHTSGMYPSTICNTSVIYPLAQHPSNKNGIIAFDLRYSPEDLGKLSADEIIARLYTPRDELPEGVERIPLKTIHINKCPVVAPVNTLDEASSLRTKINKKDYQANLEALKNIPGLNKKLKQVFSHNPFEPDTDPDRSLYGGGFFSPDDKKRMQDLRDLKPDELAKVDFNFTDKRIPEMLFRYRARNYPDSLSAEEQSRWNEYRKNKFTDTDTKNNMDYASYIALLNEKLASTEINDAQKKILEDLKSWGRTITLGLNL